MDVAEPAAKRWETDQRGRGVADARASLPAIQQLANLAGSPDWVTEEPEAHLLPKLKERVEGLGLTITRAIVESDGALSVHLAGAGKGTRRELRQLAWTVLGGVAELTTHVHETRDDGSIRFDVVTGIPPTDGGFATHGHALRLTLQQTET